MLLAALLVLACGVAIGATSIGGVLVVPALTTVADVPVARAVAAASFGFLLPGIAVFVTAARAVRAGPLPDGVAVPSSGSGGAAAGVATRWSPVLALAVGALVGATLGALTLAWLPAAGVRLAVALLCIGSGTYALLGRARQRAIVPGTAVALVLGVVVGGLSAWSGTGGPVVLLPLLALLGWPVTTAVDAAQKVQLPVAVSAAVVHLASGRLDLPLGLGIGVLLLLGWAVGRAVARRVSTRRLQQSVAVALIVAGLSYL